MKDGHTEYIAKGNLKRIGKFITLKNALTFYDGIEYPMVKKISLNSDEIARIEEYED